MSNITAPTHETTAGEAAVVASLSAGRRVLLFGGPGGGKTSLLARLAAADEAPVIDARNHTCAGLAAAVSDTSGPVFVDDVWVRQISELAAMEVPSSMVVTTESIEGVPVEVLSQFDVHEFPLAGQLVLDEGWAF